VTAFDDRAVVAQQYEDEAYLRARQAFWTEVEGENAATVLWRVLEAAEPRRVIEVGGGQGELAERLQTELGAEVAFVDQSPRMVELARSRGVLDAQVGDVASLPFPDASFDTAVAAWMLYHVPDLDRGLAELARVLEPGGRLVAVTNSLRHLEEFRDLVGARTSVLEGLFNAENGEDSLRRHFAAVERIDNELVAVVRERTTLVGYARSLSYPVGDVPEDVSLPFRVTGRSTIFVATT
jgi:SAM-dependent methyltransferase